MSASVRITIAAAMIGWSTWLGPAGCARPECASADYSEPECRVIAENELARLRTADGVELRFQDPRVEDSTTWEARGLFRESASEGVVARVAGPGDFSISLQRQADDPGITFLRLDNVDPDAVVTVIDGGESIEVDAEGFTSTSRQLVIALDDEVPVWVRGRMPCPGRFRIAVAADIQTNPTQFTRIVEALQLERQRAAEADEPLVALMIPGDLSEATRNEEFEALADIIDRLPIPVMTTPGNHDVFRPSRPYYNLAFGPGNHEATVCNAKLVMLDTGSGSIATSVQARLPELLERDGADVLIVGMHHPVYAGQTGAGWSREDQAAHVMTELAIAEADLIVAGHAHALHDFDGIPVGDSELREIIAGTAGAYQGVGPPRYGYVRVTVDGTSVDACFVEVPPPGYDGPAGADDAMLRYCDD
jgi:hypothetical protein